MADRNLRMYQQPESTSSSLAVSPASLAEPAPGAAPGTAPDPQTAPPQHRVPRWLERIELFLRVMLRLYIGLALCYAPWSHSFWDQNPILLQYPWLADIAGSGAVRGLVSGLGLLNLWIAFQDALRHRDG
jgi:hypothetical protein